MEEFALLGIAAAIVGFVTAGLKIRFDRFFSLILLVMLVGVQVKDAVNMTLWVILSGSAYVLYSNMKELSAMPKEQLAKRILAILALAGVFSYIGSYIYSIVAPAVLVLALSALALLYGLRLIFIHFSVAEMNHQGNAAFEKFCAIFGPSISGLSMGFIGTSLKPLKIPFAVRIGKLPMKKVYAGNVMTAFIAALLAIIWHSTLFQQGQFAQELIYGMAFFAVAHIAYELTMLKFREEWRNSFQVAIGIILAIVSVRLALFAL